MMGVMIQTKFLVVVILVIQKIFGEKLHAYVRYGVWLFVVLRLLMPVNLIDSPLSMLRVVGTGTGYEMYMNESPQTEEAAQEDSDMQADGGNRTAGAEKTGNAVLTGSAEEAGNAGQTNNADRKNSIESTVIDGRTGMIGCIYHVLPVKMIMQVIWTAGCLVVGGFLGISHFRFKRRLRASRVIYEEKRPDIMQRKHLPIYLVKGLESPCLAGFLRPAVYIGAEVPADSDIFRYAVAHEEVHYLHKDHIWALLRAALVTVYWFHPFVWIAAAVSARDGEIACDYGTIRRIGEKERYAYGEMLLAFSCTKKGKRIYSYGTMLRPNQSELKERILRLTRGNGSRVWAGILTTVIMTVLAGCAFTGAARDADKVLILTNPAGTESENVDAPADGEPGESDRIENSSQDSEDDIKENDAGINGDQGKTNGVNGINGADGTNDDRDGAVTEPRQIESVPADISEETSFGADGPILDFAGNLGEGRESVIMFHDYFGLVVYDLANRTIVGSLDLKTIGCHMTQGDDACQTAVSEDGTTVWLHQRSKPYMYRYEIQDDLLYQEPLVKTFEIDLEGKELFDRYLVTEETTQKPGWRSNYLYEEYQDERGAHTEYIFLCVPEGEELTVGSLQCEWDDMVFDMFGSEEDALESRSEEPEDFPYRYDGIVQEVEIIYGKPCNYSRIADGFGGRTHPVTQEIKLHEGVDYAAEKGADIVAAADGVVYATGYSAEYGNYVVLLHINGDMTYYCMCQDITVEKDMQVKRGEKIATVGSSGRSTGTHLHFALSRYGEFVDPEKYMRSVVELEETEIVK